MFGNNWNPQSRAASTPSALDLALAVAALGSAGQGIAPGITQNNQFGSAFPGGGGGVDNWRERVTREKRNQRSLRRDNNFPHSRRHESSARRDRHSGSRDRWSGAGNHNRERSWVSEQKVEPSPRKSVEKKSETKTTPNKEESKVTFAKGTKENSKGDQENKDKEEEEDKTEFAGLPKSLLTCLVCSKTMWTGMSFKRHLTGSFHRQMMKLLEEEHEQMMLLMRKHLKLMEGRREIILAKMKKQNKKVPDTKSFCTMCDVETFGSIAYHRKSPGHLNLKNFLHPKCDLCDVEFTSRIDLDDHRLTVHHLKKMHEKGLTEHTKDYYDILDFRTDNFCKPRGFQAKDNEVEDENKDDPENELLSSDNILNYVLPEYNVVNSIGSSFVKPVHGSFCRLCKKFLYSKVEEHLKSKPHYEKFAESVRTKKAKRKKEIEREANTQSEKKVFESTIKDEDGIAGKRTSIDDEDDDTGNWKRQRRSMPPEEDLEDIKEEIEDIKEEMEDVKEEIIDVKEEL